jgi:hypothetical protein
MFNQANFDILTLFSMFKYQVRLSTPQFSMVLKPSPGLPLNMHLAVVYALRGRLHSDVRSVGFLPAIIHIQGAKRPKLCAHQKRPDRLD